MTELSRAVFLSYASQDAEAARRICDALRAGGIEVWFDQSELRGGDAWDRQIRKQLHDCALFIPIISATTQGRLEGYFRREWRLAVDRTHDMADAKPFLVPVVIDATSDQDAEVPDSFRAVHWTRLPAGEASPAFIERVARLLSPDPPNAPAPVASPSVAAPHTAFRQPAPSPATSRQMQRVVLLIAAVAVIGVGYFALDKFILSKRPATGAQTSASTAPSAAAAQSAIPEKSIAVLPFVNMSSDKEQEYFSDGLSEELIDMLSKVPELRVPARTSSFYFKGKSDDIAVIAQRLHVAHVLEGSVRKAGNRLRITAQLIRADDGYHLWSESYDRDARDIFKVQDEISSAVVSALQLKLAPGHKAARSHGTTNTEAYNEYLLGRQFYNNRRNLEAFRRAVAAFRRAIRLDPNYGVAYAGLAMAEYHAADFAGDLAGYQRAESAADKAVALAPDEADGYAARGFLRYSYRWDWAGAQADFSKALDLDPGAGAVQRRYGNFLTSLGRLADGIAVAKKAIELDPLSEPAWESLGRGMLYSRDFVHAHEAIRRALEINPESSYALGALGILQLLEGSAAEALVTFRKSDPVGARLTGVAMAEHTLGHARESSQALDEAIARDAKAAGYQIAQTYAWRGELDKAFEWLDRAYEQRDGGLVELKPDLLLSNLRSDVRYKALLRKMNLPE